MKAITALIPIIFFFSCSTNSNNEIQQEVIEVAQFKGVQVTGVTVSDKGRIFANFPRWREGIPFSVVEINPEDGSFKPFPNEALNTWEIGNEIKDSLFIAVQSVVAFEDKLYVLDTRNPQFKGVVNEPRVFVVDLKTNEIATIYLFTDEAVKPNSYVNDLRVDKKKRKIYFTDSNEAGLIVLDMKTGESRRILDNHYSTLAEVGQLVIEDVNWTNTVHSDGIALDVKNDELYYHSLTGYNLYAIPTSIIESPDSIIEQNVKLVAKTPAPDGMIFDRDNNLYMADLEQNSIVYLTPKGKQKTLLSGDKVRWADSFGLHNGYLYYTNSRIHEAGDDVSNMVFTINKVKI